jgi:NAD(P)-dependent dehydrogenase (short-subunit alcohol dehydrogenase family)
MLVQEKVALVTGAASGLGAETAKLLAREGARVVLVDVQHDAGERVVAEITSGHGDAIYFPADVRSSADLDAAVAAAEESYGALHIVVANAGILGRGSFRRTETIADDDWQLLLDVNLSGVFRTFRAAIPALRRAGGGAMSATSSVAGKYGVLYATAYSATKGGINAMVRSLAVELAPDRIRVNAVCAGSMPTDLHSSLDRPDNDLGVERPSKQWKERMIDRTRDRLGEAARAHLFLCSELSAYVTGEAITVDGGFSIWNGM